MIYFHVYHETRDETRDSGLYNVRIFYHQCLFVVVYCSMQLLTLPRIRHICLLFWGTNSRATDTSKISCPSIVSSSPLPYPLSPFLSVSPHIPCIQFFAFSFPLQFHTLSFSPCPQMTPSHYLILLLLGKH